MSAWKKLHQPGYADKFEGQGNVAKGAKLFKAKCAACHTIAPGGASQQGPNLYNMLGKQPDGSMGRLCGSNEGKTGQEPYDGYSSSMINFGKEGLRWDGDHLLVYLKNPKAYTPGTKMVFAGLRKEKECADLLAYMESDDCCKK